MEEIINIIAGYGVDTVVLALIINILTGLIKIPVKRLSLKLEPKGINIKKYITLLPIILGFAVSALASGLVFEPGVFWSARTPVLALTASSLSLSIYAICEKFFGKNAQMENTAEQTEESVKTKELIGILSGLLLKPDDRNIDQNITQEANGALIGGNAAGIPSQEERKERKAKIILRRNQEENRDEDRT